MDLAMKIGIVTEYFYPTLGGITENIYHFSRELLRHGHDLRIITGRMQGPIEVEPEIRERIITVGTSMPVFFNGSCGRVTVGMGLTRRMKELLASERFDLLHLHSPIFPTLPVIANMNATCPVVGTFHTCTKGDLHYRVYRKRLLALLHRMAGRIAVSPCCAEENQRIFDLPFDVIPNGVDVGWWANGARRISRFDDGRFNVLFLGRPDTRNGLETLIRAFVRFHRERPHSRLIIVGDGPLRFYFERLVPNELQSAVVFEGAAGVTRPHYLASADAFCFTPTIASFGITILEGMSAGKAIIASDIEAFRALITHEESALLVPPSDEEAMASALLRLEGDPDLRGRLASTAAMRVEHYDWKRIASLQIDYYERVLAGKTA
jgi:phosphatidyl-myo-inositol alpha-mannosyltransferase